MARADAPVGLGHHLPVHHAFLLKLLPRPLLLLRFIRYPRAHRVGCGAGPPRLLLGPPLSSGSALGRRAGSGAGSTPWAALRHADRRLRLWLVRLLRALFHHRYHLFLLLLVIIILIVFFFFFIVVVVVVVVILVRSLPL